MAVCVFVCVWGVNWEGGKVWSEEKQGKWGLSEREAPKTRHTAADKQNNQLIFKLCKSAQKVPWSEREGRSVGRSSETGSRVGSWLDLIWYATTSSKLQQRQHKMHRRLDLGGELKWTRLDLNWRCCACACSDFCSDWALFRPVR